MKNKDNGYKSVSVISAICALAVAFAFWFFVAYFDLGESDVVSFFGVL